jgi:hypothetical protein
MRTRRLYEVVVLGVAALSLLFGATGNANASLFIPISGTDTILDTTGDDVNNLGPLTAPGGFTLFGAPISSVFASTNGFLSPTNLGVGDQFNDVAFPLNDGIMRIAPFWDDLVTPTGQVRSNGVDRPGTLAVIWNGVGGFAQPNPPSNTFEAVLLGTGNPFGALPGTIVFSYTTMGTSRDGTATIGLNAGDGVNSATIPGLTGTGGVVTGPPGAGPNNFPQNATFTFTPNGAGGYTVTPGGPGAPSAVPEPSSLALLALGGGALAGWRRWRKRTAA